MGLSPPYASSPRPPRIWSKAHPCSCLLTLLGKAALVLFCIEAVKPDWKLLAFPGCLPSCHLAAGWDCFHQKMLCSFIHQAGCWCWGYPLSKVWERKCRPERELKLNYRALSTRMVLFLINSVMLGFSLIYSRSSDRESGLNHIRLGPPFCKKKILKWSFTILKWNPFSTLFKNKQDEAFNIKKESSL